MEQTGAELEEWGQDGRSYDPTGLTCHVTMGGYTTGILPTQSQHTSKNSSRETSISDLLS